VITHEHKSVLGLVVCDDIHLNQEWHGQSPESPRKTVDPIPHLPLDILASFELDCRVPAIPTPFTSTHEDLSQPRQNEHSTFTSTQPMRRNRLHPAQTVGLYDPSGNLANTPTDRRAGRK
jgi:hypothetical protein